jgi:hypothetical protein
MLHRFVTAGTVAGTTLLSPLTGAASAAPDGDDAPEPDIDGRECVIDSSRGAPEPELRCYPSLAEALRDTAERGLFVVATHYTGSNGTGTAYPWYADSCSDTFYPTATWRYTITSTRMSSACSGAKHYTGTNCSGNYQIVSAPYPNTVNLASPLDNNVGCVKYA